MSKWRTSLGLGGLVLVAACSAGSPTAGDKADLVPVRDGALDQKTQSVIATADPEDAADAADEQADEAEDAAEDAADEGDEDVPAAPGVRPESVTTARTVVLNPGAEGVDALISNLNVTQNYGDHAEFSAGAWTSNGTPMTNRSLIRFDLSSVEAGTVLKATLALYADTSARLYGQGIYNGLEPGHSTLSGPNDFNVRLITQDWDEHTVNWANQPTTSALHALSLPSSASPGQDYSDIDVTALVQDSLQNPKQAFGFEIQLNNEAYYREVTFGSSDNPNAAIRPKLVLQLGTAGTGDPSARTGPCYADYKITPGSGYGLNFEDFSFGQYPMYQVWDFGDGSVPAGGMSLHHDFPNPGTYKVCLSLSTGTGCSNERCKEVEVPGGCEDKYITSCREECTEGIKECRDICSDQKKECKEECKSSGAHGKAKRKCKKACRVEKRECRKLCTENKKVCRTTCAYGCN
jgi:PKD repeat protein